MEPEELKVGMWTTGGWPVTRFITRIEGGIVYCREFQQKDVEDDSYTTEAYVSLSERLATAAEIREHVPEHLWPAWARENLPNPGATPAVESTPTPLPWDKTEELRTVDGRKVHHIYRGLSGDWSFALGDDNPGPCLCDDFGRLRGTDIEIIRRATPAELDAEMPTPKVKPWTLFTMPTGGVVVKKRDTAGKLHEPRIARPLDLEVVSIGRNGGTEVTYHALAEEYVQHDGSPCGIVEGGGE